MQAIHSNAGDRLLSADAAMLARHIASILWRRKLLVAAVMSAAFAVAIFSLVAAEPYYMGEAFVQISFSKEAPATGTTSQLIASLDGTNLVETAARVIRSRAIASAVVASLHLDRDRLFATEPWSRRLLAALRRSFGTGQPTEDVHDIATDTLLRSLRVSYEPRSYLISVKYVSRDPERAARLANAVAAEYLRGQRSAELTADLAAAQRYLGEVAAVYGVRHPNRELAQQRVEDLQRALRQLLEHQLMNGAPAAFAAGQQLVAASKPTIPSGPNALIVLSAVLIGALLASVVVGLVIERSAQPPGTSPGNAGRPSAHPPDVPQMEHLA
jgi:uncharacterized protein involved in exopolysaccharide biosynthesis